MTRIAASLLSSALAVIAQVPAEDARNGPLPTGVTHFKMPAYGTLEEWRAHADRLRTQILWSAGLLPTPEKVALHPQVFGRIERQGYSVEKVLLETLPGFYLGGNLYRPRGRSGRFPAVGSPHGHSDYGRLENTPTFSEPGRAINLARQGYVVFSYDMVGYNDTIQARHEWGGPHGFGGLREELWSLNTMGLQLWNAIRVIDFLQSLPDVDPERIAFTGASGGGTQTFLIAAVDSRVKVAAPVNMVSAILQGGTCQSAPGLRLGTFNVEFGAMMAPRPLLLVSATGDWTRNTPTDEFPTIQSIYRLYGRPELVESVQVDAPHNYNRQSREAVYRFFGKHLLDEPDGSKLEKPFQVEKLHDLLALHNRKLPENALTYEQLVEQWVAAARRQNEASTPEELRERLSYALAADWPTKVLSQAGGERIVLSRAGKGDRVPGIWIPGERPASLIVHPEGAEAARKSPEAQRAIRSGHSVLMIDAYQTGKALAPRRQADRFTKDGAGQPRSGDDRQFLVFNKSDAANRVQDILTALAFLANSGHSPITLAGLGDAAAWSVFAAAVAKTAVTVRADLETFRGEDRDFMEHFFVPGIQRAGGLRAASLLAAGNAPNAARDQARFRGEVCRCE